MIEFGHITHTGLRRKSNEDTYAADASLGLWLVADGMGGHALGEIASAMARDTITREIRDGTPLITAIRIAAETVSLHNQQHGDHAYPMGTTVIAMQTRDQAFELAWVGDSRAYLWHEGRLSQISCDHSRVQQLVDNGLLSAEEARRHPQRNIITQALGVTPASQLQVASTSGQFRPGNQVLLCSDGLTEHVDDAHIAQLLAQPQLTAQECCDTLVAAALDGGGSDNITVLLLRQHP